jgi:dihydroflavonol-4-reductase
LQLLAAGHQVRTTVRNLKRKADVLEMLRVGGADEADRYKLRRQFEFAEARSRKGCGMGGAGPGAILCCMWLRPFRPMCPNTKRADCPGAGGTLRVLRASRDAGVKRVVLTSSFAAIGYGHKDPARPI